MDLIKKLTMEITLLGENIKRATAFMQSDEFPTIDKLQQELLVAQVASMTSYYRILESRIRLLNETPVSV